MAQSFEVQASADGIPMLQGGFTPIALDRLPGVAEALFISVAVLRHDRRHSLGTLHRHAQTSGRSVIENVHGVLCEIQRIGKRQHRLCERIESVFIPALFRNNREPEARKIGRDDAVSVGEARNEFPVLKRRCREPMQQQHNGASAGPAWR